MSEQHATLSASGSAKWLSCPAALALEALIDEPDTGSPWSREGTAAHAVLEQSLREGKEPSSFLGDIITVSEEVGDEVIATQIEVTQDMVNAVEVAVEYVDRLNSKNAFYEEKVDYTHIAPDGFGTADVVLEVLEKVTHKGGRVNTLYVIDYKHGAGVKVDAFENSQGMLYGIGALNTLEILFERDIERVIIVIIQPRMDNISEYEISVKDLLKWGESIKPKAQKAHDLYEKAINGCESKLDPKDFNPTKKGCLWCQGNRLKRCKAIVQAGYEAALEGFEDLTAEQKNDLPAIEVSKAAIKDPALLDNADLAAVYPKLKLFSSFVEDLGEEIRSRINKGEVVPGLKLMPTEKPRSWKLEPEETVRAIRTSGLQKKDYLINSIISPTEAEKKLEEIKPKDYERRYQKLELAAIHRLPGKDKIVEDNTKPAEDFEDLDSLDLLS